MKTLITGISGFAGSFLAEYLLKQGQSVEGLVRPDENLQHLDRIRHGISLVIGDLTSRNSLDGIFKASDYDVVFHLAGEASPAKSFQRPELFFEVNVMGTLKLFEAIRHSGRQFPRIVLVTSSEIYGLVPPELMPVTEETGFNPESPYAVSKVTVHYLGRNYFLNCGLPVIEARAFNHIGPRQATGFVVPDFCSQLAGIATDSINPYIRVGNLESRRDFVDVRDVVKAYHLLATSGIPGESYNICSGTSVSIRQILERLIDLSGVPVKIVQDSAKMRPSRMPEMRGSNHKIAGQLGWRPEISLEQSLKDSLEFWRGKSIYSRNTV